MGTARIVSPVTSGPPRLREHRTSETTSGPVLDLGNELHIAGEVAT